MPRRRDPAGLDIFPPGITPPPDRRCRGTTRNGNPCALLAIPGGTVCEFHGGTAPSVRRKAQIRLAALVDPAIATLARELASTTNKPSDRLRAAENVLDRAGFPRRTESADASSGQAILIERLREVRDAALTALDPTQAAASQTIQGTVVRQPEPVLSDDRQETP